MNGKMTDQILEKLKTIEQEKGVKILYACESGSRAWGFPSKDSDYDVRFIYVHPAVWYLGISQKRDVIEVPVGPVLDVNGWDLRKTLILLKKSNGALLEWLSSPIVYQEDSNAISFLKELAIKAFLPKTTCWHYYAMARNMMDTILADDRVKMKTYLYALRPTLCCLWIIEKRTQPPMEFSELISAQLTDAEVQSEMEILLSKKAESTEKETIPRNERIDDYLKNQIKAIGSTIPENHSKPDLALFDSVFVSVLRMCDSTFTVGNG